MFRGVTIVGRSHVLLLDIISPIAVQAILYCIKLIFLLDCFLDLFVTIVTSHSTHCYLLAAQFRNLQYSTSSVFVEALSLSKTKSHTKVLCPAQEQIALIMYFTVISSALQSLLSFSVIPCPIPM